MNRYTTEVWYPMATVSVIMGTAMQKLFITYYNYSNKKEDVNLDMNIALLKGYIFPIFHKICLQLMDSIKLFPFNIPPQCLD